MCTINYRAVRAVKRLADKFYATYGYWPSCSLDEQQFYDIVRVVAPRFNLTTRALAYQVGLASFYERNQ